MQKNPHKAFYRNLKIDLIFVIMGFSAMASQVLILRQMMSVYGGNELVVGAVLFGWVFWAGLGNLVASYIADRVKDIHHLLSLIINLTAIILPCIIFAAGLSKFILGYSPAQIVGLPVIIGFSFILLAPFCFLIGASLTVAAKLPNTGLAKDIGVMYLFDALGAGIGGLVATWFAIQMFSAFQVALMTSIALLFVNAAILVHRITTQILTGLITIIAVVMLWTAPGIEHFSVNTKWAGYNPIVNINSHFGNLVVTEKEKEHTLFTNGAPLFSTPLHDTYETSAILPLLMHPDPKNVLLIGGGLSGMLYNWRDLDLQSITYIQLDPEITRLERDIMVGDSALKLPALKILHKDALEYLTEEKDKKFDIIIIKTGTPDNASSCRFLTDSFFHLLKDHLSPNGVLSFGVFQPGNALGPEAKELLGSIKATLGNVFKHNIILPFDEFYFLASPSSEYLTDSIDLLKERLESLDVYAPVLKDQYFASIFPERIEWINNEVESAAIESPKNTILKPFAYFAGMLLWASRTQLTALDAIRLIQNTSVFWIVLFLLIVIALSIPGGLGSLRRSRHISAFWILFSVGFASITYEITLLIFYQLKHGLLFYMVGIIITAFMVGLSLGAYLSIRIFQRIKIKERYLLFGLLLLAAYQPLLFVTAKLNFIVANFLCGFLAGMLFEASAEWMVKEHEKIGHTAGWLNCADYWGSAVGSLLASIIAIPLFGLVPTLIMAASLPIAASIVLGTGATISKG